MEDPSTVSGGGILASSWFSPYVDYAPSQGRLNNKNGSWCPNRPDKDPHPYLQVTEHACFRLHSVLPCQGILIVVVVVVFVVSDCGDKDDDEDSDVNVKM